jgi:polyhydroxyalkanoate synthesis regulator phasin
MTNRDHRGVMPHLRRADIKTGGTQMTALPAALTDSTTGSVSDTLDDSTANTKDDLASLAAKVNALRTQISEIRTILEEAGIKAT